MTTIPEGFRGEYATRKKAQEDFTTTIGGKEQSVKKGQEFDVQAFIAVDANFVNVWIKGGTLEPEPVKMDIENVVHNEKQKTVDFSLVLPNKAVAAVQLENPTPGRYLIHVPFAPLRYLIVAMFTAIEGAALEETRKDLKKRLLDSTEEDVDEAFALLKKKSHWDDLREALLGVAAINFTLGERFTTDTTVPETTTDGPLMGKWDLIPKDGGVLPLVVGGGAALILLLMVK